MTTRRRRSRSFSRAPRRRTAWTGRTIDPAIVAAGGQNVNDILTGLPDATENPIGRYGLTIMRIVGSLRINSTDVALSTECGFGFIMVDGDASAASAFPEPTVDEEAPWLHWDRRVVLPPSDSQQHLKLDIRARRRMGGNDISLFFIINNDDATQSLEYALGVRVLLALP